VSTLQRLWRELGNDPGDLEALEPGQLPALPAPLPVARLVHDAVAAASLAASALADESPRPVRLDPDRLRTAVTSEKVIRVDGEAPDVWADLSGFWPTSDGWLRTHANYPHHRSALLTALGLPGGATKQDAAERMARLPAAQLEIAITQAGGVAGRVRTAATKAPDRLVTFAERAGEVRRPGSDPAAPLRGFRVLDLTRVLAGPVCTRLLAQLGADVLRIDPPHLPELGWLHLDTGAGKRSAVLDARSPEFAALVGTADIVVAGYRPGSLERLGVDLSREGLIVGRVSAWGRTVGLRGFDSIVQATSGIAAHLAQQDRPGALPAQGLDHSAGYALAAGILSAVRRGVSAAVDVTLDAFARELLALPPEEVPPAGPDTVVHFPNLTVAAPAVAYEGLAPDWPAAPRPLGSDEPAWAPHA